MHPRVFAALGADLVTNDVVALIELVKNSYDAFAKEIWIRFCRDEQGGAYIEIEDSGVGMNRYTIENIWCVVATPFKLNNPTIKLDEKERRVSGEKGLGRLSAARLGSSLLMLTKSIDEPCWQVKVNWGEISDADSLNSCYVSISEEVSPFKKTGTLIKIFGLNSDWDEGMIDDLKDNLARLISPFIKVDDFDIYVQSEFDKTDNPAKITSPKFLSNPKYRLKGSFKNNSLSCKYFYSPMRIDKPRSVELKLVWDLIFRSLSDIERQKLKQDKTTCGNFDFEIRAWDIDSDGIEEIAENFRIKKSSIRNYIRAHKGISVYRDGILVLPKSDNARDWLGLDLRRVSKIGTRLSTSQIVGHVSITKEQNPKINDTSDRERLASTKEVKELETILKAAVGLLENERDSDRVKKEIEKPLENLFEELSADDLLAEVLSIAEDGAPASDALPILKAFNESLDHVRKTIQDRFVYYSRMATVGTIAQMLVHEIRNRTTIFGLFLKQINQKFRPFPREIEENYQAADMALNSLEQLAETFAPLASRSFRRRKRDSNLKERIDACLSLQKKEIDRLKIRTKNIKNAEIHVAVDPGELDAILLNLIINAVYWLPQSKPEGRVLEFRVYPIAGGERIRLCVDDSGPGIRKEDVKKVLWPGVTRKPGGIGMGLTVAAELVAEYDGRLSVKHPGNLGGASFIFDLPLKQRG
ncbi:MAG: ATP-binding protein [Candidatus Methylomirabilis sp.]|nr:ATP-binding protein [Deltaproteobacteria bacterium]